MSQIVHCRKYRTELPGLEKAPMPGKRGEEILASVSAKAWGEWQALQTRLINEKQLNLIDPEARTCLLYTSPSPRDQRGSRMPSSA